MLIIISQDSSEVTTNEVIDWLNFYNVNFRRINGIDIVLRNFMLQEMIQNSNDINVIWCRRTLSYENLNKLLLNDRNHFDIDNYFKKEIFTLIFYSLAQLKINSKTVINKNYFLFQENKLEVLSAARNVNIDIPDSYIVSSKKYLSELFQTGKEFITKGISGAETICINNEYFSSYTVDINVDDLNFVSGTFVPCLVQEKLDKLYEIRSFYLNMQFYSMVIFSQQDEQTKLDFRVYNLKKMNRVVPYKIPKDLEFKLAKLLKKLKFETASIDLIKTKDNRYVFLEINPDGQFGMVSKPCNYFLEKKMAQYLTEKMNNQ